MEVENEAKAYTTLHFDLGLIENLLAPLSLTSVKLGGYIIVMKNQFDVTISGEPYVALLFLLDLEHGLYLARIWNQTVASGKVTSIDQFMAACKSHFNGGKPCIGCPMDEQYQDELQYLVSQTPMPRKISKQCHKVLGEKNAETASCPACMELEKLNSPVLINRGDFDIAEGNSVGVIKKEEDFEDVTINISSDDFPDEYCDLPDANNLTPENDGICLEQRNQKVLTKKELNNRDLLVSVTNSNVKCPWCEHCAPWGTGMLTIHKKMTHFYGTFRCPACPFKGNFAGDLIKHIESEEDESLLHKSQHCPKCHDTFPLLEMEAHYGECKSVHCSLCLFHFGPEEIEEHYKICVEKHVEHSKKPYRNCKTCAIKFYAAEYFHHFSDCDGQKALDINLARKRSSGGQDVKKSVHHHQSTAGLIRNVINTDRDKLMPKESNKSRPYKKKLKIGWKAEHLLKESLENSIKGVSPKIGEKTKQILNESIKTKMSLWRPNRGSKNFKHITGDTSLRKRKRWTCLWCGQVMYETTAEHHKKIQHCWGKFRCQLCDLEFPFVKDLLHHVKQNGHEEAKSVSCPICRNLFPVGIVEAHYKSCVIENEKQVTCEFCFVSLPYNSNKISRHMKMKHFFGDFICPVCYIGADFAEDLVSHMEITGHATANSLIDCPSCKLKLAPHQLKEHVEICFQKFYNRNQKPRVKEEVVCSHCGKLYANKESLHSHTKIQHPPPGESVPSPIPCDICGEMLKSKRNLQRHISDVHKGQSKLPHTCSICNQIFPTRSRMLHHKDKDHTGTLQCDQCGFTCETKKSLRSHSKVHEEAQFECSVCEMKLRSKPSLIAHEREHTGERPFKCDVCGNGYKTSSVLATHRKHVHKILTPGQKPIERRKRKIKLLE